jgi:hypothetical protein
MMKNAASILANLPTIFACVQGSLSTGLKDERAMAVI